MTKKNETDPGKTHSSEGLEQPENLHRFKGKNELQQIGRRKFIFGAAIGAAVSALGFLVRDRLRGHSVISNEQFNRTAITDLIMRERVARETGNWKEELACFDANATVEVSWFKGTGAEFVETTKKPRSTVDFNFDSMSPAVITIRNSRAIADTACAVHESSLLDGVEVIMTSYTRLLWRLQSFNGKWLIVGLRGIYIRDQIIPSNPNRVPKLDESKLASYRASYRYLSYMLANRGAVPLDNLPGVDRPETVATLRAGELKWLTER